MTNTKKITKRECYNTLMTMVDHVESEGVTFENEDMTCDALREFIAHEIELLDNKAAAAAKRAQAKRDEGDALRARILEVMSTEDFMTIPEIVKALGDESVSAQRASYRLRTLVAENRAEKTEVSVPGADGGKASKKVAYRKIVAED